ncbi:MBL fold metallo-hydrolase [Pseudoduganella namucuonensis]|uniref:Phosphoribosyl 1,2-cyclic phosphodiesterase n=1 Tax=Pseudoduganella namucuonensis TaxID=1035707 RepID=A0A1I7M2L6_9BURK|nr:MBL fold metallo-hydrolase [Pseudoduganella namucuonensis]SFV16060.1 Phosphoribosyl 1,2-cyclic phosphodiesterase [Pseudoduganella namucuonensis]
MKARIWGARGSLPVALTHKQIRAKLVTALEGAIGRGLDDSAKIADYIDNHLGFEVRGTFGGHSSCVEVEAWDPDTTQEHVILDMGSGVRPLGGSKLAKYGPGKPQTYHVFMSHLHWDHIMGFPFFTPAYIPGNRIVIHGCHAELERAFRRQQEAISFPVTFDQLGAKIEFRQMEPGVPVEINGLRVTAKLQLHAGDSYGYRLEHGGQTLIYSTDSEHKLEDEAERQAFVDFFRDADLVIFDAMYSLADAISVKADWGHSSNVVGVELCQLARARRLCLFHHEPIYDDAQIARVLAETRRYAEITGEAPLEVLAAYDGMEIDL